MKKPATKFVEDDDIRAIFSLFDKNNDNTIDTQELQSLFMAMGRELNDIELKKVFDAVDTDKSGRINFNELSTYIRNTFKLPESHIEEVVNAFKFFDQDKSGKISKEEFNKILKAYGDNFTNEEIDELFQAIDTDKDGSINYAEFVDIWKYQ